MCKQTDGQSCQVSAAGGSNILLAVVAGSLRHGSVGTVGAVMVNADYGFVSLSMPCVMLTSLCAFPLLGKLNQARSDNCAAAIGEKIYVAGGYEASYNALATVEVFDPATGLWTPVTNMTIPRGDCEASAFEDRFFYVLGGWGGLDVNGSFQSAVEAYDTQQNSWSRRADMLMARGDFAAEALPNRRIIVMGGETTNGTANEFALHHTEEYIAADDVWIPKAPLAEARFRHDTAHVKDRVYVFGGHPTCASYGSPDKPDCVAVALNSTWGYFDVQYPNLYALVPSS